MKRLAQIALTANLSEALEELRRRVTAEFEIETMILYGSVARGEADEESDQDILVLTARPISLHERDRIIEMVFEVNLQHSTNISVLVLDRQAWEEGLVSVMPIHDEILAEGVLL